MCHTQRPDLLRSVATCGTMTERRTVRYEVREGGWQKSGTRASRVESGTREAHLVLDEQPQEALLGGRLLVNHQGLEEGARVRRDLELDLGGGSDSGSLFGARVAPVDLQ